jgi:hypothetical protein
MTIREYYGYALVAGIQYRDARHMTPGFILDMYVIHTRHEVKMRGGRAKRKR